jgi:CheY-like chemotaxis protein
MVAKPKVVVVAEDEALVRLLAVEVLTAAGYEVIEAGHAAEALDALEARPGEIRLLFTDVNMPGTMDGLALAHHVRAAWPHIALLIASGQHRPPPVALPADSVFLAKPYEPAHVLAHAKALIAAA